MNASTRQLKEGVIREASSLALVRTGSGLTLAAQGPHYRVLVSMLAPAATRRCWRCGRTFAASPHPGLCALCDEMIGGRA